MVAEVWRLIREHSMADAVVEEIDGRRIRVGGHWLHNGVLPALAGEGTVLVDLRAHRTIQDAAMLAAARGATVRRFRSGDVEHARRLLKGPVRSPRVVCIDGINSMPGNPPDLPAFAALAREHDALLYVDDAHGFGIVGERDGYDPTPYGRRGNAIVRWFGEHYERIVLTAGFSKAYSSLLAFVTCSAELKQYLKAMVPSCVYSGPVPVASLATALAGLEVNQRRGDDLRAVLWHRTRILLDHLLEVLQEVSDRWGFRRPSREGSHAGAGHGGPGCFWSAAQAAGRCRR
jgi:8-amino-7-oxononanoate synthase